MAELENAILTRNNIQASHEGGIERLRADLATMREERDGLREENEFLHDAMDNFEWQRINSMSHEEVKKELLASGYTQERLDAGFAKIRATVEKVIAVARATKQGGTT